MEDCGENQVCVVGSLRNGRIFHRGCLTKNQFESKKAKCEKSTGKRKCIVAMCDTPNCRPELPQIGRIRKYREIMQRRLTKY